MYTNIVLVTIVAVFSSMLHAEDKLNQDVIKAHKEFMVSYETYCKTSSEVDKKSMLDKCVPLAIVPVAGGRDEMLISKETRFSHLTLREDVQFISGNVACLLLQKISSLGNPMLMTAIYVKVNDRWVWLGADIEHMKDFNQDWKKSYDEAYGAFKVYKNKFYVESQR
jgi:hypothetical protein